MSDDPNLSQVVQEHRYEIDTLKEQSAETNRNMNRLISSMDKMSENFSSLSTNFAVYAEKHDRTRDDVTRLADEMSKGFSSIRGELNDVKKDVQKHNVIIAGHSPVIDSLRKLNQRLLLAAVLFVASSSTVGYFVIQSPGK